VFYGEDNLSKVLAYLDHKIKKTALYQIHQWSRYLLFDKTNNTRV
jgi:hypothetical protein